MARASCFARVQSQQQLFIEALLLWGQGKRVQPAEVAGRDLSQVDAGLKLGHHLRRDGGTAAYRSLEKIRSPDLGEVRKDGVVDEDDHDSAGAGSRPGQAANASTSAWATATSAGPTRRGMPSSMKRSLSSSWCQPRSSGQALSYVEGVYVLAGYGGRLVRQLRTYLQRRRLSGEARRERKARSEGRRGLSKATVRSAVVSFTGWLSGRRAAGR